MKRSFLFKPNFQWGQLQQGSDVSSILWLPAAVGKGAEMGVRLEESVRGVQNREPETGKLAGIVTRGSGVGAESHLSYGGDEHRDLVSGVDKVGFRLSWV